MQTKTQAAHSESATLELEYKLKEIAKIYCGTVTAHQQLRTSQSLAAGNSDSERTRRIRQELVQNKL